MRRPNLSSHLYPKRGPDLRPRHHRRRVQFDVDDLNTPAPVTAATAPERQVYLPPPGHIAFSLLGQMHSRR